MKTVLGFGLVLLAVAAPGAFAGGMGASSSDQSGGVFFLFNGPASSSARTAQGYLGVSVRDVTPDQLGTLKLKDAHGAEIILVDHDAPAGKAGLREHDVVLQINGQAIAGKDQLSRTLHESAPGKSITLLISRDGQQMTITTQMAVSQEEVEREASEQRMKVPEPAPAIPDNTADNFTPSSSSAPVRGNSFIGTLLMNPSYTGVVLEKMSTQQANYFGDTSGIGLLVRSVVPNSPAALAGLQACDIIEKADEHPIATPNDWTKVLKNSHGHPLTVIVMRDKKEQTITLTPDGKKRSSVDDDPAQPDQSPDPTAVARVGLLFLPRS
jgi:S1-C subfamily serine protease